MPTRAAPDQHYPFRIPELLLLHLEPAEFDVPHIRDEPAPHSVCDRLGLLEYLFEHEVRIAALLDHLEVPLDLLDTVFHIFVLDCHRVESVTGRNDHLFVLEIDHLACMLEYRCNVTCYKILLVPDAYNDGRSVARADDLSRFPG